MLTWLESLFAAGSGRRQPDTEPERAARAGDDDTGAADADHTGGGATDGATTPERDSVSPARELVEESLVSKRELRLEFGLSPPEFLVCVVRDEGGQTWQGVLVKRTGWSKSTVSRYLCSLESDGTLKRIPVGRRKLVCVPGEMPDIVSNDDWPASRSSSRG